MLSHIAAGACGAAASLLVLGVSTRKGRRYLLWATYRLPAWAVFKLLGGRM